MITDSQKQYFERNISNIVRKAFYAEVGLDNLVRRKFRGRAIQLLFKLSSRISAWFNAVSSTKSIFSAASDSGVSLAANANKTRPHSVDHTDV